MQDLNIREYAITAIRDQQLWASGAGGELVRAWCPEPPPTAVGRTVSVYLSAGDTVLGWHDHISDASIDARLMERDLPSPGVLRCTGRCGRRWIAAVADRLLSVRPACLECGGRLGR